MPGFLDVFHDAGDDDILAIGESVHIHFGRVFEKLIDQDRALGIGDPRRSARPASRIPRPFSNRRRSPWRVRRGRSSAAPAPEARFPPAVATASCGARAVAPRGCGIFNSASKRAEATAIFSEIDRFRIGADDFRAIALQFESQIQTESARRTARSPLAVFRVRAPRAHLPA